MLLHVVVVGTGDYGRSGPPAAILELDTGHALAVVGDLLDVAIVVEPHAFLLGYPHHRAHDFVHAAHGIPRTEHGVGVVHEAVQGWGFFRFGAQEQHREFDDLQQAFVAEELAGVRAEAAQQGELRGLLEGFPGSKLHHAVGGLLDKPIHADLVLDLRLVEEVLQGLTRAGLDGIEGRLELAEVGRDFDGSVIKPNGIGWVEAHQVELLGHIATELFEIRFKDVGHPVPTRPHVEREPFGFKHPRTATRVVMALEQIDLVAQFRQLRSGSDAGEACADDERFRRVGGCHGHKTTLFRHLFNA